MTTPTIPTAAPLPELVSARLACAREAARAAGERSLEAFGSLSIEVITKGDGSPVTAVDRACEAVVRDVVLGAFPDDAVLGEELGETPGGSGFRWIVDPIDGTASFIRGVPLYACLIGIEHRPSGAMVAGVIHMPALGETVWAGAGSGAWHVPRAGAEPRAARVSAAEDLSRACVVTTSPDYFRISGCAEVYDRLWRAAGMNRGWSDAYGPLLLATGRIDAMAEPHMHPWDAAALLPIIEEAGGRLTDWHGRRSIRHGTVLATNGRLHAPLLELLGSDAGG